MDKEHQSRQARLQEIQAKKEKLAELRRNRQLLKDQEHKTRLSIGGGANVGPQPTACHANRGQLTQPTPNRVDRQKEIETLLSSIDGYSPRTVNRSRPGSTVSSRPLSGQRLSSGSGEPTSDVVSPTANPTGPTVYSSTSTQTLSVAPLRTVYESDSIHSGPGPKQPESVSYERGTQTDGGWEPKDQGTNADDSSEEDREYELERIRADIRREVEEELRATLNTKSADAGREPQEEERYPMRNLTKEEQEAVLQSPDFIDFIEQSTKVMERALDEEYDILVDYTQGSGSLDDEDDAYGKGRTRRGRRVKQIQQFWDEKWSKRRMISDIAFSPKVGF
jgi:dynein intermediate chain